MSRARQILLLGLLLLWPVAAQQATGDDNIRTPGLSIEVTVGLGGRVYVPLPVPVLVEVHNATGEDIEGVWHLSVGAEPPLTAPARLPKGSRKRIPFYVDMSSRQDLRVALRTAGDWLHRQPVPCRPDGNPQDLGPTHLLFLDGDRNAMPWSIPQLQTPMPTVDSRPFATYRALGEHLPVIEAPLHAFHAVAFLGRAGRGRQLDRMQLRALGSYLFAGGVVAAPVADPGLVNGLLRDLPNRGDLLDRVRTVLDDMDPHTTALRAVNVGAGKLCLYGGDLARPGDLALVPRLGRFAAAQPEPTFPRYVAPQSYRRRAPFEMTESILLVVAVFALYALIAGPVLALVLRRASRRRVAMVTGIVLGVFAVLSLVLGVVLRQRPGVAQWLTVTELTPDGGIQYGWVTCNSTGGQHYRLLLRGRNVGAWRPDARRARYGYRNYGQWTGLATDCAFAVADPGQVELPEQRELEVPLPPWGCRPVMARAHAPAMPALEISGLRLEGRDNNAITIHFQAHNGGRFALRDVRLFGAGWVKSQTWRGRENVPRWGATALGELSPGRGRDFTVTLQLGNDGQANLVGSVPYGERPGAAIAVLPPVNSSDHVALWIVATLDSNPGNSPGMSIGDGDFEPGYGEHLIIQRLEPALAEGLLSTWTEQEIQAGQDPNAPRL